MSTGKLYPPPEIFMPYKTQCYVCDKTYCKYFLPIWHAGAIKILKSPKLNIAIARAELSVEESDTLLNILYNDNAMRQEVFGKLTIMKYQVTGFFIQLIATGWDSWTGMER